MLACAAVEPALGSPVLGSALRLVLHPGDHMHAVALLSDAGHFDLVLSHGEDGSHEHDAATGAALASNPSSSGDHVFHLTSDDPLSATQRRLDLALAAASAPGISRPLVPHSTRGLRVSSAPRARSLDSLSTVVLRI
jgi:hypothetical protein